MKQTTHNLLLEIKQQLDTLKLWPEDADVIVDAFKDHGWLITRAINHLLANPKAELTFKKAPVVAVEIRRADDGGAS